MMFLLAPLDIWPWILGCMRSLLRRHTLWAWMVQGMTLPSGWWKKETSRPNLARCCLLLVLVDWEKQHWQMRFIASQGQFDCKAFVSVSQKPDINKIMKDVISQVSCQDGSAKDTSDWDEIKSISKLRELLQNKRYLIIIDDVWSAQAWNTIKCAFPENNCSSRIIVTTRIIDVAKSCCLGGDDQMYELKSLSDLHSRILFFKRIFGSEKNCPDMLEEISNNILKKCGGLPLAIISIAGLLANRPGIK
uniref:NB-ARC domain-containing protein n=1 Tax=Aegilops tauschii subsp. strangulata TaxID=200361 RepID=A0A453MJM1_AEGTS